LGKEKEIGALKIAENYSRPPKSPNGGLANTQSRYLNIADNYSKVLCGSDIVWSCTEVPLFSASGGEREGDWGFFYGILLLTSYLCRRILDAKS